jgi:RNA polymerase sigma-70 factor (ECF subfamily)
MDNPLADIAQPLREQKRLFDAYFKPLRLELWRYCHRLTGSAFEAEDLVQDTLVKAFAHLTVLWQPINPRAYLFRIASRTYLDAKRGLSPAIEPFDDVLDARASEELGELGVDALDRLVRTLTPLQRTVVLLTQVFEFTAAEAALLLDTSPEAIAALLHRARKSLREPESSPQCQVAPAVLQRFCDAFNAKDIPALVGLLHESVVVDIVGIVEEHGRDKAMESSLKHTLADEDADEAIVGQIEGLPVILLLKNMPEGRQALSEVIVALPAGDQIVRLTSYYFSAELLAAAANELGMESVPHAYD